MAIHKHEWYGRGNTPFTHYWLEYSHYTNVTEMVDMITIHDVCKTGVRCRTMAVKLDMTCYFVHLINSLHHNL